MNKFILYPLLILVSLSFISLTSCKKENGGEDAEYNTLYISDGANDGYQYTFPTMNGFRSEVTQTTHSYWLVFGDEVAPPNATTDVMDFYMYYYGQQNIIFPSNDGQFIHLKLKIEDQECVYTLKDALLTIYEVTDFEFTGVIDGTFYDGCNNGEEIRVEMDIRVPIIHY